VTVCDKDGDVDRGQARMRCVDGDRWRAALAKARPACCVVISVRAKEIRGESSAVEKCQNRFLSSYTS
jgi:hypothetical protein